VLSHLSHGSSLRDRWFVRKKSDASSREQKLSIPAPDTAK